MINKDFFAALEELEEQKGIKKEIFIEALQNALAAAYRKQYIGKNGKVEVKLNPEKGSIKFFAQRTVVEEVLDKDSEISLEEAREIKASAKIGDVLR
ncbi:MAG: transcription termination/antitermination protein NusA, partial [Clostridia bacterium]|nr:transcription termination/antitermination protein NusA [Clostridia bacterium]